MEIHLMLTSIPKHPDTTLGHVKELFEIAAEKRGHTITTIQPADCKMKFIKKPQLLINGETPSMNILIVRAGFNQKNMEIQAGIIKQFELVGIPLLNAYDSIILCKNKVRMTQILSEHNIPIPKTFVIKSAESLDEVVKSIGSLPIILKSVSGSHGVGVSIIESKRALHSLIEMMTRDEERTPLIVQEYIKESSGKDIRVFVVNNKVVAAMERIAKKKGEFRSNFSMGGIVKIATLSAAEKKLAIKATKIFGLDFAGVDIIRSKTGPKILEVNSNPGLTGITEATGVDVAGHIIDLAVEKAQNKKKKR